MKHMPTYRWQFSEASHKFNTGFDRCFCREDKEMMVHQVSMVSRVTQVNQEARVPKEQTDKRFAVLCSAYNDERVPSSLHHIMKIEIVMTIINCRVRGG